MSTESEQALKIKYKPLTPEKGNYIIKTPEYWCDKLLPCGAQSAQELDVVKQIQCDSYQAGVEKEREDTKGIVSMSYDLGFQSGKKEGWKEGMLEAAELVLKGECCCENASGVNAIKVEQAILTAIENKEKRYEER